MFNLAIDSKLCGCDLVKLKVKDVAHGDQVLKRAMVMQQKPHQPVQFKITEQTRTSVSDWIKQAKLKSDDYLFPSRIHGSPHITPRQYVRIVEKWVASIGLNPADYGTPSFRRTNLPADQEPESRTIVVKPYQTAKRRALFLGVEVDDTLEMAEHMEVILGTNDRHTRLAETLKIFVAAPTLKLLWLVQNARHQNIQAYSPSLYEHKVSSFIGLYMPRH